MDYTSIPSEQVKIGWLYHQLGYTQPGALADLRRRRSEGQPTESIREALETEYEKHLRAQL